MSQDTSKQERTGLARKGIELLEFSIDSGLLTAGEEYGDFMDVHCKSSVLVAEDVRENTWHLMQDGTVWYEQYETIECRNYKFEQVPADTALEILMAQLATGAGTRPYPGPESEDLGLPKKDWTSVPQPAHWTEYQ